MPNPFSSCSRIFASSCRGSFLKRSFSAPSSGANPHTLSSRVKRGICFALLLALVVLSPIARAQTPSNRPRILGITEVRLLSTDLSSARDFYTHLVGANKLSPNVFYLNPLQSVALFDAPSPVPSSLVAEIVFETDSLRDLSAYLTAQKIQFTPRLTTVRTWDVIRPAYSALSVLDPDGHRIGFRQRPNNSSGTIPTGASRIIHAGFVVHDRAAMEHFYKDILGFKPYWHGGMKDGETDWLDLQVPDGTDWIEFMLNVPANADKKLLGVMNHIALCVPDIHAAQKQLLTNGMKLSEEPQIGRDGKWQLNLYDPDDTRVELMEFSPTQKPCCSEYTGPHPKP